MSVKAYILLETNVHIGHDPEWSNVWASGDRRYIHTRFYYTKPEKIDDSTYLWATNLKWEVRSIYDLRIV